MLGLKSSCEGKPRAQIFTAKLTALFSHASVHPTSGTRENRCETTDTADWPAAYVQSPGERVKAERNAIRDSGRHVQLLELPRRPSPRQVRLAGLEQRYWELMRAGMSNTEACRLLGMHRQAGTRIRKKSHHQTLRPSRPTPNSGRYLTLRERLQIADLERLGYSIRKIATELGRHPSTVKRELDRNRDKHGRHLPHGADDAARL